VIDKASNGKDEIADKVEGDSPGKTKRLVVAGMEDVLGGRTLGQYELMERLRRGGMGTVYKAYQRSLDRYVAVKVLSTFLAQDPDFTGRFQREARMIAKLDHPNILPVYDYGQEGELIYIVMRYVEGGTLQDKLDRLGQPMDLETAVEITAQMGEALDYAHQQGIVHRDVKPSNVLMADGNWALLTDFGLARMIGGGARITQIGSGMGTPSYVSPEQARDKGVDGRSDIYSLGVVLYEMLTGRVPFEGETPLIVLYKHLTDPPPPPREINPDIPEAVERVVLKALAKDPADRFQRVGDIVTALQQAVSGAPLVTAAVSIEAEGEGQPGRLAALYTEAVGFLKARWRRLPTWVWAAMVGAILLAVVIVGAALRASPTDGPELPVAVAPTSTPMPPTATSTPTVGVAATETALADRVAGLLAASLDQTATAEAAFTPTPTDTPAPTATKTPTQTPVPPMASPTPAARKTPTNTSTVAPTAKTPRPTHTSTPPAESYPAPVLIGPEDGANPGSSKATFSWRWDGQLQENEYFDLRMWPEDSTDHRIGVMDYRKIPRQPSMNSEYVVDASIDKVGNEDRTNGTYYWSVAVMREVGGEVKDVSPEAIPHKLIYALGGEDETQGSGKPAPP
jgi:predicted Ser/Thr protein kinase